MAALVILSSSPCGPPDLALSPPCHPGAALSSSPLPSPSVLFKSKHSSVKNGAGFKELAAGVIAGFTSAAVLNRAQLSKSQITRGLNTIGIATIGPKTDLAINVSDQLDNSSRCVAIESGTGVSDSKRGLPKQRQQKELDCSRKGKGSDVGRKRAASAADIGDDVAVSDANAVDAAAATAKPNTSGAGGDRGSSAADTATCSTLVRPAKVRRKKTQPKEIETEGAKTDSRVLEAAVPVKKRKSRATVVKAGSTDKPEKQTKLPKRRITKPGVTRAAQTCEPYPVPNKQDLPFVSEYFPRSNFDAVEEVDANQETACPRKIKWTQIENTCFDNQTIEESNLGETVDGQSEGITRNRAGNSSPRESIRHSTSFASMLGSFSCDVDTNAGAASAVQRNAKGKAITKRRRLEMIDGNVQRECTEEVKRSKAPKKKPRTVTEAATAAYRMTDSAVPIKEPRDPAEAFFAPRKAITAKSKQSPDPAGLEELEVSRKEMDPARLLVEEQGKHRKKTTKSRKKVPPALPKLLTPSAAMRKMTGQDFLFGTSSQLAGEGSPSFIRDMQRAIEDSEHILRDQTPALISDQTMNPAMKTLSKLRASKGLWSAAARDFNDETVALEIVNLQESNVIRPRDISLPGVVNVDLLATSIANSIKEVAVTSNPPGIMPLGQVHVPPANLTATVCSSEERQWVYVSPEAKQTPYLLTVDAESCGADGGRSPHQQLLRHAEDEEFSVIDCLPSRTSFRTNGKAKDYDLEYVDIDQLASPDLRKIYVETTAQDNMQNKYALEEHRPQKDSLPRGPEVHTLASTTLSCSFDSSKPIPEDKLSLPPLPEIVPQGKTTASLLPAKRPRGRPRKNPLPASESTPTTSEAPVKRKRRITKTNPITSPPPPKSKAPEKDWLSIEEIEDSEPEPTSTPPRRRSPPSAPLRLELSPPIAVPPAISALPPQTAAAFRLPSNKLPGPGRPQRPRVRKVELETLRQTLFKDITATVLSCARTTDLKRPSWWEKILMYDPIVLEDFTAWLNEKGVRFRRPAPVGEAVGASLNGDKQGGDTGGAGNGKKGRGKRKVVEEREVEGVGQLDLEDAEGETVQAWMVQKWCEEKSICCFWRNGPQSRVKSRY